MANRHRTYRSKIFFNKSGVTLVEIMVAMVILGFSGLALLTGLMQSRRYTELAIHENTALTIGQGYIEQIKNMEFVSLDETVLTTLFHEGVADTLSVSPLSTDPTDGNAGTDIKNRKRIDIKNTPDDTTDDLSFDVYVYIENITNAANKVGEARRILLRYEYSFSDSYRTVNNSNTLYAIRSDVPTF
tara:strand:+ start:562 stop:1122 length:561 start_codon:yes stop_codon:yes gene_type:complete